MSHKFRLVFFVILFILATSFYRIQCAEPVQVSDSFISLSIANGHFNGCHRRALQELIVCYCLGPNH